MEKIHSALIYQIEVIGRIPIQWLETFTDLQLLEQETNSGIITKMIGVFPDQAKLQGLLNNLYNLGLILVSLECLSDLPTNNDNRYSSC